MQFPEYIVISKPILLWRAVSGLPYLIIFIMLVIRYRIVLIRDIPTLFFYEYYRRMKLQLDAYL